MRPYIFDTQPQAEQASNAYYLEKNPEGTTELLYGVFLNADGKWELSGFVDDDAPVSLPAPTEQSPESYTQTWRDMTSADSVKLKMVLAQYGIYDDIEQVISTQNAMTRLMWQLATWSRNNANLIAMVTQLRALPEVQAVVGDDVDAFMDRWFADVQTLKLD